MLANNESRTAVNRGRCASFPTRVVMASIVTGTVGSIAAVSERIHLATASGLIALWTIKCAERKYPAGSFF